MIQLMLQIYNTSSEWQWKFRNTIDDYNISSIPFYIIESSNHNLKLNYDKVVTPFSVGFDFRNLGFLGATKRFSRILAEW
jgi:hypothetical protein